MTFTRPSTAWSIFAVCLAVLLFGMAWLTVHTLHMEENRLESEELQERIRLALWRMDSAAGALVVAESGRAPNQFKDFHAADQAYTNTYQLVQKGQVLFPSPLLNTIPVHAKLYCQTDPWGTVTSPQVPSGNNRDLAEQNYITKREIESASALLERAKEILPSCTVPQVSLSNLTASAGQPSWEFSQEEAKNDGEFKSRAKSASQRGQWAAANQSAQIKTKNELALQQAEDAGVNLDLPDSADPFEGVWQDGELFLIRNATLDGRKFVQSVWLDAESIRKMLLEEIRDLLPNAALTPVSDAPSNRSMTQKAIAARSLNLVSLPFHLEPGPVDITLASSWSPLRRSLLIAWGCVLGAAIGAGALILGIVGLSERRAAFVSAVTHEMRTPLTTFRLYSEMLSGGMVKDAEKQQSYLKTLSSEASRLGHLVENVLAYARLEKGSARAQVEEISLQSIIDRVKPRLEQRAGQDDFEIQVDTDESAATTRVKVDLTAVEQILFNLVDNACKYGRKQDEGAQGDDENGSNIIHLEADTEGPMALLRVRDHGRGISKAEERRLFKPFEKSASKAAHTAPGVGLGLALCRKLSRALGGELKLCDKTEGACFILALPAL